MRRRTLGDIKEAVWFMAFAILATLVAILYPWEVRSEPLPSPPEQSRLELSEAATAVTEAQIVDYIRTFVSWPCRDVKSPKWQKKCMESMRQKKRWNRAPELARMILAVSLERNLDPWSLVITVRCESSFFENVRDGEAGEQGLTQMHGKALQDAKDRGYDLDTSLGQLRGGADHLVFWLNECNGSMEQAFNGYRSGSCRSSKHHGRRRLRMLERARVQFGRGRVE